MPVLELTTTGRRSSKPRSVMLTAPLRVGDAWVVVASRGGDDRNPAWYLNLCATPEVRVSVQGAPSVVMTAHVAAPAERAEMWKEIAGKHKIYAQYQDRTEREIPLVLLVPA